MKKNTPKDYAIALYETTIGLTGAELEQALHRFVVLLFQKQKSKQAATIISEFEKYAKKQEGIVGIEITSAHALTDTEVGEIKKVFGKNVEAIQKIDADLIGGIIVREENKIFDASVKTQLSKLKLSLM